MPWGQLLCSRMLFLFFPQKHSKKRGGFSQSLHSFTQSVSCLYFFLCLVKAGMPLASKQASERTTKLLCYRLLRCFVSPPLLAFPPSHYYFFQLVCTCHLVNVFQKNKKINEALCKNTFLFLGTNFLIDWLLFSLLFFVVAILWLFKGGDSAS